MRVGIQAPQTPWSRGAAFQTFYELGLTRERGAELVPRQPGATQHHGNIAYIFQVKADLRRRADWPTLCSLCDSGRLMVGKLLGKASVVLRKTPLFEKALLSGMHEWGGWG